MPNITPPSSNYKLIGKNYTTPDLVAKVTGKAKYAEDYRADGMLFCKLLLSPMPHARVRSIDARAALAMPGVKAILTVDDLPAPADSHDRQRHRDHGQHARAIAALTNEPLFQGEPILAVAAVDELTAAEAIEKIKIDLRAAAVRRRSAGEPAARRTQRADRRKRLGARAAASAEAGGQAAQ